jgi:hypothetical protein
VCAAPGIGVTAGATVSGALRRWPQAPQKRPPGRMVVPHCGQRASRRAPHWSQKRFSAGFSLWQLAQRMTCSFGATAWAQRAQRASFSDHAVDGRLAPQAAGHQLPGLYHVLWALQERFWHQAPTRPCYAVSLIALRVDAGRAMMQYIASAAHGTWTSHSPPPNRRVLRTAIGPAILAGVLRTANWLSTVSRQYGGGN